MKELDPLFGRLACEGAYRKWQAKPQPTPGYVPTPKPPVIPDAPKLFTPQYRCLDCGIGFPNILEAQRHSYDRNHRIAPA